MGLLVRRSGVITEGLWWPEGCSDVVCLFGLLPSSPLIVSFKEKQWRRDGGTYSSEQRRGKGNNGLSSGVFGGSSWLELT